MTKKQCLKLCKGEWLIEKEHTTNKEHDICIFRSNRRVKLLTNGIKLSTAERIEDIDNCLYKQVNKYLKEN